MNRFLPAVFLVLSSGAAFAADPSPVDLSSLTSAFNSTTIITGIMAIASTLALIYVAIRGVTFVLGLMKSK